MKDLVDVPQKVLDVLKIVPVIHMDEVLQIALHPPVEKPARHKKRKAVKVEPEEENAQARKR